MEIFCFYMAVELKNSMFIHVPKTGGRWVKQMLFNYVEGATAVGDEIYNSHNTPPTHKQTFAFLRHPMTFAHSLFHHRARKKANKYGNKWNWQEDIRLERKCKAEDYETFLTKIVENKNVVKDYYDHYTINNYPDIKFGYMETLCNDLIIMIDALGEKFDEPSIYMHGKLIVGGRDAAGPITVQEAMIKQEYLDAMNESEKELFERHEVWMP